jgi:hypothetical protein
MFATAITAWRRSQPDIRSRSRPPAVPSVSAGPTRALLDRSRVDRVNHRPSSRQPFDREPIR